MSTSEAPPPEEGPAAEELEKAAEEARKRRLARINEFLEEKWGKVPPPCPYCRVTAWNVDTDPIVFQRIDQIPGFGVPAFLVFCANCGHEIAMSAQVMGLWEDVTGHPLPEGDELTSDEDESE